MSAQRPTDPTIPGPHESKDAPRSNNSGEVCFMPYVPAWERLPDVIGRLMAGGRPKELAQADLCRAIADGTVNIRCQLIERRGSRSTSKASLEGKAFEIPTEIKPEDFDWEASRPIKPWFVRRGCSLAGHWDLAWIQVSRADVKKALCLTEE